MRAAIVPPRASVALALLATVLLFTPASATVWVAAHQWAARDLSLEVRVDDVTDMVQMTIIGPSGVWLSYGFDAAAMAGTYAVVALPGGSVQERTLGNHNAGALLPTSSIIVDSWTDLGDGTAQFVLSRPRDPGTGAWVFPVGEVAVPIIYAVGTSPSFGNHGSQNRSSGILPFGADAVAVPEGVRSASWGATKLVFLRAADE